MGSAKPLPFSIRRQAGDSLTDQVVRGFRQAIRTGHYAPGEQLPTLAELARALGVSLIVARHAVRRLVQEGLVVARRKHGIRVCEGPPYPWRAHVLQLARASASSYYFAVRDRTFQDRLRSARVRVSAVLVDRREVDSGFAGVRSVLESDPSQLAVLEGPSWGVLPVLKSHRLPFVQVFAEHPSPKAAGTLKQDEADEQTELVAHLAACGIRSALVVIAGDRVAGQHLSAVFRGAGIKCEFLAAQVDHTQPNPQNMEQAGLATITSWLSRNRRCPDLIYFGDDFLGRGGLMALVCAGKRVPEDVQVISTSNRGHRMAFPRELTCLESDPVADGEAMADLVLKVLDKPRNRPAIKRRARVLVVGQTTRPRRI